MAGLASLSSSNFLRSLGRPNTGALFGIPSALEQQTRNFGAGDLKIVAARMKSVKSIQKITKAMKMVAASKLRMDQRRLEHGLPFATPISKLIQRIPVDSNEKGDLAILALSSDKGLCGGVNTFVAKQVRTLIKENELSGNSVQIYGVGDKIRSALQRTFGDRFRRMMTEVTRFPWNFTQACLVSERLMQDNPARLMVVYNHFKSAVAYDTLTLNILTPIQATQSAKEQLNAFEFEPERADVWKDLHDFYYASTVFGCMLDNVASEQSARMSAMDNASTNAGDMISALTLRFNRARQAKITTELVEIISGANALE
ncbi:ATP synthase F1 gamma subunit [Besnoitia besnoiti]|uniref:ATP synthase subunit gamma, mitochondrial n=1 Tax=Besnoitia besnoiti TaxID=94643 RepID=A0A2A9MQZ6_BESBE|nr:ATP synthase F1 gamma subunit [Besnoitia besnoiti]PFH38622.1 ATP synthase F1 gamma subunit [Besnoitia besnoiti]